MKDNQPSKEEEELKAMHREEIKTRNESTKVWIQSDTQCREYCHKLEEENERLREALNKIQSVVDEQAEDPGLWSFPIGRQQYISEAHLQQELRLLHNVIECQVSQLTRSDSKGRR